MESVSTSSRAAANRATGERGYENLSDAEKILLQNHLRSKLDSHCVEREGTSWKMYVDRITREVIQRRAAAGDDLSADALMAVLEPILRAAMPPAMREDLFRMVATMVPASESTY